MLQNIYDKTGFMPNLFDCITPPNTEVYVQDDGNEITCGKPNDIYFYVAERWLNEDKLILWVTAKTIRPVMIGYEGNEIKF